jgi:hypothetical protein
VIDVGAIPVSPINWPHAVRIIRSLFPPIDLFEDIAEPADWPLLIAAEQKTNPRLMQTIGNLDLVPPIRRVSGPGASWLMAPFTHVSTDRPSRFSNGSFGVLYVAGDFETALFETVHHHAKFMAATAQPPGWTSQFRELVLLVKANLHDLRGSSAFLTALEPDSYTTSQDAGKHLHAAGSEGVVFPSVRRQGGQCAGLFYPDLASGPVQGRHLSYHWDGAKVDYCKDVSGGKVYSLS